MERFSRRTISVSEGRRRSHNQEERGRFIFGSSNDWDICPFLFPYTSSTSSLSFLLLLLHLLNLHPFHLSDIILQKYSPPSSSTSPSPASPPVQVYLEVEVEAATLQLLNQNRTIAENTQSREQQTTLIWKLHLLLKHRYTQKKLQEHGDHHPFVEGEHRNWRAHNAHRHKVTFWNSALF